MARFAGRDFGNIVRDMREIVEFNAVGKDAVLFDAPCLILFHAKKSPRFPQINAHLALQNAILMAESLGLGSFVAGYVLMAFMYKKKLSRIVEIPKDHVVHGALGVGYPRFPFSHIIERGAPAVKWL
jgi:nitroreductase